MKKILSLLVFALVFTLFAGCGGSDSKDKKSAYGACEYGSYQCFDDVSYYCGYSGDSLIWKFSQKCSKGCDSATGLCKSGSNDSNGSSSSSGNNSGGGSNNNSNDSGPETRTVSCTGLPANAEWNTASSITQTKEGSSWTPSAAGTYNATPSTEECRYKCVDGYTWNGSECFDPCEPNPCSYIESSTEDCIVLESGYKCDCVEGFFWNGTECVDPCTPNPCNEPEKNSTGICNVSNDGNYFCECKETFTWNENTKECLNPCDPNPCDEVENSTGVCNKIDNFTRYSCKCEETFTWNENSRECLNPCYPNPCDEIDHSNGVCNKIDNFSEYSCGCEYNYEWKISACVGVTRTFTCSGLPARAEWNSVASYNQRWNETDWNPPDSSATYNETASTTECRFKCKTGYAWNGTECTYPECSKESYKPCVDSSTGLMWSSRSSNKREWDWADSYCENLGEGGFHDWRLPNIDELRKTVRNCQTVGFGGNCKVSEANNCLAYWDCWEANGPCFCEAENVEHGYFSKVGDSESVLWSSSIVSDSSGEAWMLMFSGNGNSETVSVFYVNQSSYNAYVRCVR